MYRKCPLVWPLRLYTLILTDRARSSDTISTPLLWVQQTHNEYFHQQLKFQNVYETNNFSKCYVYCVPQALIGP